MDWPLDYKKEMEHVEPPADAIRPIFIPEMDRREMKEFLHHQRLLLQEICLAYSIPAHLLVR